MKAASQKGDTLIVVRVISDGKMACSKPCDKCLLFAKEYGIKKIIFVNEQGEVDQMRI